MTSTSRWFLNAGQGLGGANDKGKVQEKREEGNRASMLRFLEKQKLSEKINAFYDAMF